MDFLVGKAYEFGDYIEQLDLLDSNLFEIGKQEMQSHNLVIAGITRDNEAHFEVMKKNIERIGDLFKDYRVILFENDSKDGTKKNLNNLESENSKVKIIVKDFNIYKRPNIKFLATARNFYLKDFLEESMDEFDVLMVVDMDMPKGYDIRSIKLPFANYSLWDVSCANGVHDYKGQMYDAFAYRDKEFPYNPKEWDKICSKDNQINWVSQCQVAENQDARKKGSGKNKGSIYWHSITSQIQKIYPVTSSIFEVNSCFGGFSFYKRAAIKNCLYDSIDEDCEHVKFNECIKNNGGKIFLNPGQVLNIHYKEKF